MLALGKLLRVDWGIEYGWRAAAAELGVAPDRRQQYADRMDASRKSNDDERQAHVALLNRYVEQMKPKVKEERDFMAAFRRERGRPEKIELANFWIKSEEDYLNASVALRACAEYGVDVPAQRITVALYSILSMRASVSASSGAESDLDKVLMELKAGGHQVVVPLGMTLLDSEDKAEVIVPAGATEIKGTSFRNFELLDWRHFNESNHLSVLRMKKAISIEGDSVPDFIDELVISGINAQSGPLGAERKLDCTAADSLRRMMLNQVGHKGVVLLPKNLEFFKVRDVIGEVDGRACQASGLVVDIGNIAEDITVTLCVAGGDVEIKVGQNCGRLVIIGEPVIQGEFGSRDFIEKQSYSNCCITVGRSRARGSERSLVIFEKPDGRLTKAARVVELGENAGDGGAAGAAAGGGKGEED